MRHLTFLALLPLLLATACASPSNGAGGGILPTTDTSGTGTDTAEDTAASTDTATDTQVSADTASAADAGAKAVQVVIKTSMGSITVELNAEKAPITVANFLSYVDKKHYDGLLFHRVIKGFMIQGGGMTPDGNGKKTDPPIKNEAANGLKNLRGTIAMARTSVVDSATSQFFINLVDNAFLDYLNDTPKGFGYAVFGGVTSGLDVVDAIGEVKTTGAPKDKPLQDVIIESVRRK